LLPFPLSGRLSSCSLGFTIDMPISRRLSEVALVELPAERAKKYH
jgi:hypothetical protein